MTATGDRIWAPYGPEEIGVEPDGPIGRRLRVVADIPFSDGRPVLPDGADEVGFFVLPYLRNAAAAQLFPQLPALRAVQTLTAGVDNVLARLPDGVTLCNARGVHDASTAELALALTLAALRGLPDAVRAQRAGEWNQRFRPSLADRTVLLLGYGAIGEAIEARLRPFEPAEVIRVARTARDHPHGPVHAFADLPRLLPRAEVVMLVVPLTEETRGLVDARFLARMRDGALLVNVARGPVVDTAALLAELEAGRLRAALDVTDPEPLPSGHPLWHAPNTLITPHVGGASSAFSPRARRLVRDQLLRLETGEPLANIVAGPGA